ncbi:MAG: 16S rRNA (cytidine(1402)-2'-O)-methyltransferase [Bacilli bacterium]
MGTLYVVATPIGNLNDFSKRGIETLSKADLILAEDTRHTINLLNHFNIKNKMVSYHKFNETRRGIEVIQRLKEGLTVALVSDAGTPCISDPGYIIVKMAREEGIKVIGIPGASAVITSLSVSGLDTSCFSFYGFVPTENKLRKALFKELKTANVPTKVLYESPKRILKLLKDINKEIPGCVVCVCNEITKVHESSIYGKTDDVINQLQENTAFDKGEYTIIINNKKEEQEKVTKISLEALIVDEVIKNNCSLKDAVEKVNESNKEVSKKEIYSANLNLKNILR